MIAALVAMLLAVVFVLAAAPDVPTIDLSFGGGTSAEIASPEPVAPMNPEVTAPAQPAWVTDPLASPLQTLAGIR